MKIKPIILAAGFSSRFGQNKLLYEIDGKPLFRHIVDKVSQISKEGYLESPLVVTQYNEIYTTLSNSNIECVKNKSPELGISSSIKSGIINAGYCDAFMFFTADQPYITVDTIKEFITSFIHSNKQLGCVHCNGKSGNPTIFNKNFQDKLMSLQGDKGGKLIINKHKEDVFFFSVTEIELKDIDFLEDI